MGTKNLIVYGAGSVAQLFLHEYGRGGYGGEYRIVGLLSDYGSKEAGAELEGYRILGSRKDLARIAQEHGVEDLVGSPARRSAQAR